VSTQGKLRVFVSSVQKELQEERLVVQTVMSTDLFLSAHCEPVLYEYQPAASNTAFEGALQEVDSCKIYLLIVGSQYGTREGMLSITHHEYRRAKEKKLHILAFIRGDAKANREEGTKELLSELAADRFKYKRFSTPTELQKEVRSALAKLLRDKFGIEPSRPLRYRHSLRRVLVLCLLGLVGSILVFSVVASLLRRYTLYSIQEAQRRAQAIEVELQRLYPNVPARYQGSATYWDGSSAKLAEDSWNDGRLEWRTLFFEGRPVARDKFLYRNDKVVGKERSYIDETKRIFLVDEFASDGLLISKRSCPEGPERPCAHYLDFMRSPLPPLGQMFVYR
jgi:hypothetical protein